MSANKARESLIRIYFLSKHLAIGTFAGQYPSLHQKKITYYPAYEKEWARTYLFIFMGYVTRLRPIRLLDLCRQYNTRNSDIADKLREALCSMKGVADP